MWFAIIFFVVCLVLMFLLIAASIGGKRLRQDTRAFVAGYRKWEREVDIEYQPLIREALDHKDFDRWEALIDEQVEKTMRYFDRA